ncbi:hypothetical protein CTRI78_v008631 [Colletotrichum trifolii]|uniref:Uncharacterized protein n=1 Tax=Colletotrichum trifolii TaxID=5466 RepID=A0A4R8QT90_COLTR|nr:hypothetical protein CTRI78_v008631 [Colletotrichum trifolii]
MQDTSRDCDTSSASLGQRRGISDLARFALDLTWATPQRAESETPARPRAYPSPPMSGSPPLPSKANPPEAGDRGQPHGSYPSTGPQDAYRGGLPPTTTTSLPGDIRGPPPPPQSLPPPSARPYHTEQSDRMAYSYPRPDEHLRIPASGYAHRAGQALHQRPPPYMQMPGPPPPPPPPPTQHQHQHQPQQLPHSYSAPSMPQPPQDNAAYTSPKTQRKTKGHVASACVPCKRAHLRNGKEDACVDVQHKKRGRPRLRDDREGRYGPSTYPHPQDAAARRPLSLYSPGGPISGYDDPIRRSQSYRVLKSQPSEPLAPRYLDRASPADANLYSHPPHISAATGVPEPVMFLTMDLDIARASQTFCDAVGISSVRGRKLLDIVLPADRDKVHGHQRQIQDERARNDPVYLPPIFGKQEQERVFESLRFEADEISRFQLDRQDFLAFASSDGQPRSYSVRMGLAKRDSIYFVVLLLNSAPRYPYPSPSPHAREIPYSYQPHQQQQAFAQHTPISATFEPNRPRYGDSTLAPRPSPGQPSHLASGVSPGVSPGMPSYAASPSRPDYAVGPSSYQIPRSELPSSTRPPQPSFQLPPIRASPHQPPQPEPSWPREERSGRVDIGGLLEKPEPQQRRPQ